MTKEEYWDNIYNNAQNIINDIYNSNQGLVAKKLNMTSTKLNYIVPLLRAIAKGNNK